MATNPRRSRVFSISMPPEMAAKAEALARQQDRTVSELMRDAFRSYCANRLSAAFDEIGRFAELRNPKGYTEEDIPRLVAEMRTAIGEESKLESTLRHFL